MEVPVYRELNPLYRRPDVYPTCIAIQTGVPVVRPDLRDDVLRFSSLAWQARSTILSGRSIRLRPERRSDEEDTTFSTYSRI